MQVKWFLWNFCSALERGTCRGDTTAQELARFGNALLRNLPITRAGIAQIILYLSMHPGKFRSNSLISKVSSLENFINTQYPQVEKHKSKRRKTEQNTLKSFPVRNRSP